ncbi:hypothetical protein N866_14670 [Actinotalea ferrariae CF5-4]|uniref:Uncharacterized protein n=1 Tax=Actinotalea ferrariae CF5-4 TaxID=948458 RepID=A0A021VL16_9CELL|nr:hypothetical protein N866_14670 [Actinotalea ferrariae CF5-4]
MVHKGEFVVNAESTQRNRSLLEAINRNGYAAGGYVQSRPMPAYSSGGWVAPAAPATALPGTVTLVDADGSILARTQVIADGAVSHGLRTFVRGRAR